MENQDLKTKLVNSIAVTHPELHRQLMNLSAQVPEDVKVSLNESLSKIHVSDEQVEPVLQNLIDKLTAIKDSTHNKNNYMLLTNSEQGPKPANLLVSHTEHPIVEEVDHEVDHEVHPKVTQPELITSKIESVAPKAELTVSKPEPVLSSKTSVIKTHKRKYIYIGLGVLLLVIIVIIALKYRKPATPSLYM
jgi:hypothetical protein